MTAVERSCEKKLHLATRLIHNPGGTCPHTGAVTPPIYLSSTFAQKAPGVSTSKYDYSRTGNPTREVLEATVADLEEGAQAAAFSSGTAALSGALSLLKAGDHVLATEGLYGGTYRLLTAVLENSGIQHDFVDTTDPAQVENSFKSNTRALVLETPSNPLMRISNIAALAEIAHRRNALLIVDNTFMSPVLQRPLALGADIVVHSATKFLGGHSDLVLGVAIARDKSVARSVRFFQNAQGAVPSPFDCYLVLRGLKTLALRVEKAQETALRIASYLASRPDVREVYYPALASEPQKRIHQSQAQGPGTMLSFRVSPEVNAHVLVSSCKLWTLAVSLGAVESIITLPSRMTHGTYPPQLRRRLEIDEQLVRLSVGIEDAQDLIEDLTQAFDRAKRREAP